MYIYIYMNFIGYFTFYLNVLQNTQKNENRIKKTTKLIYCISDEIYDMSSYVTINGTMFE